MEEFHNLLEWFEDNYINRLNRNGRRKHQARFHQIFETFMIEFRISEIGQIITHMS